MSLNDAAVPAAPAACGGMSLIAGCHERNARHVRAESGQHRDRDAVAQRRRHRQSAADGDILPSDRIMHACMCGAAGAGRGKQANSASWEIPCEVQCSRLTRCTTARTQLGQMLDAGGEPVTAAAPTPPPCLLRLNCLPAFKCVVLICSLLPRAARLPARGCRTSTPCV
jgi:hypothetical protein